ncbi:MAG: BTAD domain-containing putative transcriptional regulator [Hyphomicrobiaceae bacterium]|nr:BTAD domain-containing putative transcriptional regulator [Hyphomicrobiaceae bacterium]
MTTDGKLQSRSNDQDGRPRLAVNTIGKLVLRVEDRVVPPILRKSAALITYLAVSEPGQETRERLVGLLWSESEEERARASLRQTLYELKGALEAVGFDGLRVDKIGLSLDRSRVDVDLFSIFESVASGHPHEALLQTDRPLETWLEELESLDPAFRVWLLAKRQSLGDRMIRLVENALGHGAGGDGETLARLLIKLDPTHEGAVRYLIRARRAAGDVGGALRAYKALWDLLETDYDVEPSKETQALIAEVKLGEAEPGSPLVPALPQIIPAERPESPADAFNVSIHERKHLPKLMVSVAGFDSSGTGEAHRYLIQGFRRELIAYLVRFREWVVRDATISATPRTDIGEYVIEASALGAEAALRLVITLRDRRTSEYLWSERLSISGNDWFESQQHIVRRITTALNVHLSMSRMVRLMEDAPSSLQAYDLWLLGQATFLNFDVNNWEKARGLFRQVIAQMPDFAPAYSSLAQLNNSDHIVRAGVFRNAQRSEQSLQYAREAARLDPIDSRSQLCLGWSHAMVRQHEQAMIFIPLAYELNDNDPWTMMSSAGCMAICGEYARAREIAEHALRLPLAPSPLQWAYHVSIRFMGGDYAGAIQAAEAAGDLSYVPGYKASALFHVGAQDRAAAELRRFFDITRSRWVGPDPATDANITRWLLSMVPIRLAEDWQRVRDGLAGAGAPVEGLAHHHC